MALPPWLNVTPQMFLQAAESGGAQGLQIAASRQRALEQEAARQDAANELSLRLQSGRANQAMEDIARQRSGELQGRALDIREKQGAAELALKQAALDAKMAEDATPMSLRELTDSKGNRVGTAFGKSVKWDVPEIPGEGAPMLDSNGNVVAHNFGGRVIPVRAERAYSQAELDDFMLHPELDPRRNRSQGMPRSAAAAIGGIQPSGQRSDERVMVVAPSGQIGTIPASALQEALSNGYKLSR